MTSVQQEFTYIYENFVWDPAKKQYPSGQGSRMEETEVVRVALLEVIEEYKVESVLDLPCGSCSFTSDLIPKIPGYVGADIVEDLIQQNIKSFGDKFVVLDALEDEIPCVDLIFCRDMFVHLTNQQILKGLKNMKKSGSKYLFTTTLKQPHTELNLTTAGPRRWHPINLEEFLLGEPLKCYDEKTPGYPKYIALWDLREINFPEEIDSVYPDFVRPKPPKLIPPIKIIPLPVIKAVPKVNIKVKKTKKTKKTKKPVKKSLVSKKIKIQKMTRRKKK